MEFINQLTLNWKSMLMLMLIFPIMVSALWLLFSSKQAKTMLWFFALVMAIIITLIPYLIGFAGAYDRFPNLTFLPVSFTLFFGPLLYIYTYALTQSRPLAWRPWLLLPGCLYWFYQAWAFLAFDSVELKWKFVREFHNPYMLPIETSLSLLFALGAMILSWRLYQQYHNWLPKVRADDRDIDPVWLKRFMILMLVAGIVWLLEVLLGHLFELNYHQRFGFIIVSLLFVFFSVIEALTKSHLVYPKNSGKEDEVVEANTDKIDWLSKAIELEEKVKSEGWFLDPKLSLADLAKKMGTNRSYLSRIINDGLQRNFSDFINGMRVEYSKTLLAQESENILNIALQAGFGSKSSFNRVFLGTVGQTPSQYAKQENPKT